MTTEAEAVRDSPRISDNTFLRVGCLFLHTIHGSLGSFTRVRELSLSAAKHGVSTFILTPYEHDKTLSDRVQIRGIPNVALKIGLSHQMYEISRKVYYSKHLSKLLNRSASGAVMDRLAAKVSKMVSVGGIHILQAEQDFSLVAGKKVKQLTGVPLIADIHNITSEELVAAGIIEKDGKDFRELQRQTAENLSYADVIVVVSDLMKEYMISEYNISRSKLVLVPPGGRLRTKNIAKSPPLNFVYSGLLSYRENVELFVKSMPYVVRRFSDAKFFMTRRGEMLSELSKLASSLNVSPNFFWYENVTDLYNFLLSCYAGILPSSDDLARRMGTPAKLFEYLSHGLPVVANDIGGWTDIISRHKVGVLTASEPAQFAEGIARLIDKDREEYAQNALRLVAERYNWDNSALTLLDAYNKVVN